MTQDNNDQPLDRHPDCHRTVSLHLRDMVFEAEIAGLIPGEFPIDAWHPLSLEIPEKGSKTHIGGRFPAPLSSFLSPVEWDMSRVINLPIYKNAKEYPQASLGGLRASKEFPSGVPVATVAARYDGCYCDQRRAQAASVFLVWVDGKSLVLEVDWCEGSLEDGINPEWHLRSSSPLPVREGLEGLRRTVCTPPAWEDCSFYLYVNPPFLGRHLLGEGEKIPSIIWQQEWRYSEHEEMMLALNRIMTTVME